MGVLKGMHEYLNTLNDEQRKVAIHKDGPLLVNAGAGSGKTYTMTVRMKHLIEAHRVNPYNLLGITFTVKAANEMKERAIRIIGPDGAKINLSTFHSLCVRILRKEIYHLKESKHNKGRGYDSSFTILDTTDQKNLIKDCMKELDIDTKQHSPLAFLGWISSFKNELMTPELLERSAMLVDNPFATYFEFPPFINVDKSISMARKVPQIYRGLAINVYKRYMRKLVMSNSCDFDDLIMLTARLFIENPEVLGAYQERFRYIMVDEYQDTNHAQYILIKLLAAKYKNIAVIGDDFQCLLPDTEITTTNGTKRIADLTLKDQIVVGKGHGKTVASPIHEINFKEYKGKVVRVTTESGKKITGTPAHTVFSRVEPVKGQFYVYLMYKEGLGYRIGRTSCVSSRKGEFLNGFSVRLNQEGGDKIWILESCETIEESMYYEHYYSFKYGIPQSMFKASHNGMSMPQELVDKLFEGIDTEERAEVLMQDKLLFIEHPHHMPQAVTSKSGMERYKMTLVMFGSNTEVKKGYSHELSMNTIHKHYSDIVSQHMSVSCKAGNNEEITYYNGRKKHSDYANVHSIAKQIEEEMKEENFNLQQKARLTEEKYDFTPLSHIFKGMYMPIERNHEIVEEKVVSVEILDYEGFVFDLNIDLYHNYIANGIVVHNCIYGFRNADLRNILEFEKDYPTAKTIILERNYRSTQKILDRANVLIAHNEKQRPKKLWTDKSEGKEVEYHVCDDNYEEAVFIAERIAKEYLKRPYNDFTILYRLNAQSRVLEEIFMRYGIPYDLVGSVNFYDRKEIKDLIAYLKAIENPADDIAIKRILNVPKRGIGKTTVDKISAYANENNLTFWETLEQSNTFLNNSTFGKISSFLDVIHNLRQQSEVLGVGMVVDEILDSTGYREELEKQGTPDSEDRINNINEFFNVAWEHQQEYPDPTIQNFLEKITLKEETEQKEEADEKAKDCVRMMTVHASKGLEFPVVFGVGMEENLIPYYKSIAEENVEEERRLGYVLATRAQEELIFLRAVERRVFADIQTNEPSRFLEEMGFEETDTKGRSFVLPW